MTGLLLGPDTTGVLHVGAGLAQEAPAYATFDLPVLWVEPLAEQITRIKERIAGYARQKVIQALLGERDGDVAEFHVTTGPDGKATSSSMLPLHLHLERFPRVRVRKRVTIPVLTLATIWHDYCLGSTRINHLVLDVQGAELLVLRGAEPVLDRFASMTVEGSTEELYRGQPLFDELKEWIEARGFDWVAADARRPEWHTDHLFVRKDARCPTPGP